MKRTILITISLIALILFSGCSFEEEKPTEKVLGKITGIKSYVDGGVFSSTSCIIEINNTLDVTFKGYYCNKAEEGMEVRKYTYSKRGEGYSYYTLD